ncbi:Transcription factor-like protein [Thalictrum thalictroides]|uniref:Transcription factor-like protein n=1 Tax=Thalictrum thalictroides TaxID=46969 RepID=A0A7J6VAR1_THATH|nr:Transcription factor-like protein [Thalictrum thalictroides]
MITGGGSGGVNRQQHGDKFENPTILSKRGVANSLGRMFSGQLSMSTSWGSAAAGGGGGGSPSSTSDTTTTTTMTNKVVLASENVRLSHPDILKDDAAPTQPTVVVTKKKRAAGGDKGRGLRQFSMRVCEKVQSKGRTNYNEVADELVAEFSDPSINVTIPHQQQDDEKNIRRRVYDAINVLMAMDIISKDRKEIQWKGLPHVSQNDIEELKAEGVAVRSRIEKKAAYLQELEEQYIGLQNLIQRNEQLYGSGIAPTGGVALPFILVQTRPHATVEVEISEDMQMVHFDFNSTPFELNDDNYVLKAMRLCGRPHGNDAAHDCTANEGERSSIPNTHQPHLPHPPRSNATSTAPTSPPIPGILKPRVKHEH